MNCSFLFFALLLTQTIFGEISAIYLSWYSDPSTTMTIQWHTSPDVRGALRLFLSSEIVTFTGESHSLGHESIAVHTVRLHDLLPDTEYKFEIGNSLKQYRFRTAPSHLLSPVKFVVGGDLYTSRSLFRKMSQTVVSLDPLFAVLGGDIAYAIGNPNIFAESPIKRWLSFLSDWTNNLQTSDGRLIPFILVGGNHDIDRKYSELFFSLFDYPKKELYRALDFGSYLSLIILDTGHFSPIEGLQTRWLDKTLSVRKNLPYLFSVYHVGAYPSFYSYKSGGARTIRTHWCPLFDLYGVKAAFEHHCHTYKKTFPLKGDKIDPTGTIYFGDGCWGVTPRKPHTDWYLEKTQSKNIVYFVEMSTNSASIKAIGLNGEIIDETEIEPKKMAQAS